MQFGSIVCERRIIWQKLPSKVCPFCNGFAFFDERGFLSRLTPGDIERLPLSFRRRDVLATVFGTAFIMCWAEIKYYSYVTPHDNYINIL